MAVADALDKIASDCETITGLPKPDLIVSDVSGEEGNSGTNALAFSVVLAKKKSAQGHGRVLDA